MQVMCHNTHMYPLFTFSLLSLSPPLARYVTMTTAGSFVKSTDEAGVPTSTYLIETIEALLGKETKLKYIVYSHSHWVRSRLWIVGVNFAHGLPYQVK